jgi:translation initiation factor IF-2
MSAIINKIVKFMLESSLECISAASVIYKIIEDIPTIQKEELLEVSKKAIQIVKGRIVENSNRFKKLDNIPKQVSY